jgi:ABC-type multidrug transport system fused ATPase/permease subunit
MSLERDSNNYYFIIRGIVTMNSAPKEKINSLIIKNNHFSFILSAVFSIITASFEIALAFILMSLIDNVDKGMNKILLTIGITLAGTVAYVLTSIADVKFNSRYTMKAIMNIRNNLMDSIIRKSLTDLSSKPIGTYISALNNDLATLEKNYVTTTVKCIRNTFMMIAAICAMIFLEWHLAIAVIVFLLLPLLISSTFGNKFKKIQEKITVSTQSLTSVIKDIFSGITVVKSFNIEKEADEILMKSSDKTERSKREMADITGTQKTLLTMSGLILVVMIFSLGTILARNGYATIGTIIAFVQLLNNLTAPITALFTDLNSRKACANILDMYSDMLKPSDVCDKNIVIESFNDAVELKNVSFKTSDGKELLRNIQHTFKKGKSYALVGFSGSGKSTLLHLLAGYYASYDGSILIDGKEIRNVSEESLYKSISFVQQDNFIFDDNIENNICLYRQWEPERLKTAEKFACLDELIEKRGGDMECGENGNNLSGGERQRISIARAFLKHPEILLLDEATSALDLKTTAIIEDNLNSMNGITRIAVTHKLDENVLCRYDEIILMHSGEIKESGTYDELMALNGYFKALKQITENN